MRITFLGTGGGRHATIYQTRSTGGFVIDCGRRIHADPGPGALTNMKALNMDPYDTDAVLVSHCHPDHYSDAEVLIEGMCAAGSEKRGLIAGSESVLSGCDGIGPCISSYHRKLAEHCTAVRSGDTFDVGGMRIDVTGGMHSDPSSVGFRFHTDDGIISYVSDTSYSEKIAEQHIGARVLMLPVTTPDSMRIPFHMCTADAVPFIRTVRPELTVFVHMGIHMLRDPEHQAEKAAAASGSRVIAAKDLMAIDIGDGIRITERLSV